MPPPKIVTVTITMTPPSSKPGPATITITTDEEPVELDDTVHGHGERSFVHWDIAEESKEWKFTRDGIAIDDLGNRAFRDPKQRDDKKRHTWRRDLADRKTYKYTISVTDGKTIAVWDPTIRNF